MHLVAMLTKSFFDVLSGNGPKLGQVVYNLTMFSDLEGDCQMGKIVIGDMSACTKSDVQTMMSWLLAP